MLIHAVLDERRQRSDPGAFGLRQLVRRHPESRDEIARFRSAVDNVQAAGPVMEKSRIGVVSRQWDASGRQNYGRTGRRPAVVEALGE